MLVKALIHQPQVLILDEPTKGLDDDSIKLFFKHLLYLNQNEITILMVSHEIEQLVKYSSHFLVFKDKHISSMDKKTYVGLV